MIESNIIDLNEIISNNQVNLDIFRSVIFSAIDRLNDIKEYKPAEDLLNYLLELEEYNND